MSIFKIFQCRGFWCVIFLVFCLYPQNPAFASTWEEVLQSRQSCYNSDAACNCWIEEVFTPSRTYRIWKRCSGNVNYSTQTFQHYASQVGGPGVPVQEMLCDGTSNAAVVSKAMFWGNPDYHFTRNITCTGFKNDSPNITGSIAQLYASAQMCFVGNVLYGVDCRFYDTLWAEFTNIISQCNVQTSLCIGVVEFGYHSCPCGCIPEGTTPVAHDDLNNNGIIDGTDTCSMVPVIGDLVQGATGGYTPGTSGSSGGSYNQGCTGASCPSSPPPPDTDGDGIPDATDPDCSGPGCTTTSTSSTSNPNGTTTTTTTSTTHQGGGITPTITTTTSTSGTGSTTPGSNTTTTSGPNGTVTSGCIDVNGDGLDDGSGLECSPQARQFSAPNVTYDTTVDTPAEESLSSLALDFVNNHPLKSIVNGTRLQVSDSVCSLSTPIFGKIITISFCDLVPYLNMFGTIILSLASLYSVIIILGGRF